MTSKKYQAIKNFLIDQIDRGDLAPGAKVASENQLAAQFSVSRMTARKALEGLAETGLLYRTQGLGTFVSDSRPMSSMLTIRNIAEEITERGHQFRTEIVALNCVVANQEQANLLGLKPSTHVFHSILVFFENDLAIQLEERYVNPNLAPDYLTQNYLATTPYEYLTRAAPLTQADHVVEAITARSESALGVAKRLHVSVNEPCLKVSRRTYSKHGVVSFAKLIYPGSRYRLGGHIQVN